MQLTCPHCGEKVASGSINIQQLAAVCPACDTVFRFHLPDTKIKLRKVKQPQQLSISETEGGLIIAFRTNFRLGENEAFIAAAGFSLFFTFITGTLLVKYLDNTISGLFPLGFGVFTLLLYYLLALVVYNRTHIELSDQEIKVSRKPLPTFLTPTNTIDLSGIEIIRYEETAVSKKVGYDTPRYNVWAETTEGNRRIIVSDVVEDYAVFISQRLNELLELDTTPNISRLLADVAQSDDEEVADEFSARISTDNTRSNESVYSVSIHNSIRH